MTLLQWLWLDDRGVGADLKGRFFSDLVGFG